jgi:hypothetical protein
MIHDLGVPTPPFQASRCAEARKLVQDLGVPTPQLRAACRAPKRGSLPTGREGAHPSFHGPISTPQLLRSSLNPDKTFDVSAARSWGVRGDGVAAATRSAFPLVEGTPAISNITLVAMRKRTTLGSSFYKQDVRAVHKTREQAKGTPKDRTSCNSPCCPSP